MTPLTSKEVEGSSNYRTLKNGRAHVLSLKKNPASDEIFKAQLLHHRSRRLLYRVGKELESDISEARDTHVRKSWRHTVRGLNKKEESSSEKNLIDDKNDEKEASNHNNNKSTNTSHENKHKKQNIRNKYKNNEKNKNFESDTDSPVQFNTANQPVQFNTANQNMIGNSYNEYDVNEVMLANLNHEVQNTQQYFDGIGDLPGYQNEEYWWNKEDINQNGNQNSQPMQETYEDVYADIAYGENSGSNSGSNVDAVQLSNCHLSLYTATISLGTPPQNFEVLLDTASPDLWIPSKRCEGCDSEGKWRKFDETASATWSPVSNYIQENQFYTIVHDGSQLLGEKAIDVLRIGDFQIDMQEFGQITNFPPSFSECGTVDGGLGLGIRAQNNEYTTVLDHIYTDVQDSIVSLYLSPFGDDFDDSSNRKKNDAKSIDETSLMILGGVSQRHYMGCIKWHHLTIEQTGLHYWNFHVDHVKAGYESLHSNTNTVVLDSSSAVIIGNALDVDRFVNINKSICYMLKDDGDVGDEVTCTGGLYDIATVPCEKDDFAPLVFVTHNGHYSLGLKELTKFGFTDASGDICILRVVPDINIEFWVFGTPWFNKYYTAFDVFEMDIGFAEMVYDVHSDKIDVCQADMAIDVDVFDVIEDRVEFEQILDKKVKKIKEVISELELDTAIITEALNDDQDTSDVTEEETENKLKISGNGDKSLSATFDDKIKNFTHEPDALGAIEVLNNETSILQNNLDTSGVASETEERKNEFSGNHTFPFIGAVMIVALFAIWRRKKHVGRTQLNAIDMQDNIRCNFD